MRNARSYGKKASRPKDADTAGGGSARADTPAMQTDLSEGSVLKRLIVFALPFLAANVVQSLYNVADMLIVGRFSTPDSMSGVNIGGQVTFVLTNIVIGLCVGATVLIGQYVGRGDRAALRRVTSSIVTLLLACSVVVTIAALVFREPIIALINTPADSYEESLAYLTVTATGILFIFGYNALAAILRGMGDSKRPFVFVSVACVTNIALDLLFVAGFNWGAFGAALATVMSQAISMLLCINYMVVHGFQFDFKPRSYRIYKDQLKLILKVGLPTCAQNAVTSISFLFITAVVNMISGDSSVPSAAVGAVGKFNSFAFMPTMAISMSIATMAAQNIGAGRLDRAVKACRIGVAFCVGVMYAFFALVQVFPEAVLGIFSPDPALIDAGTSYLRIFSFDFLFVPFIFCINGLLMGGGHTVFTFFVSMTSAVLLRVPICYLLGIVMGHGLSGVGVGAPAASAGSLLAVVAFLISGRWKHNAVKHAPGGDAAGAEVDVTSRMGEASGQV